MNGCLHKNIRRLKNANRKDAENVKIRRRQLQGMRKDINDKNKKQGVGVWLQILDTDSSINTTEATEKS